MVSNLADTRIEEMEKEKISQKDVPPLLKGGGPEGWRILLLSKISHP